MGKTESAIKLGVYAQGSRLHDAVTWFDPWAPAEAVNAMCLRCRSDGFATHLGMLPDIKVRCPFVCYARLQELVTVFVR